MKIQTSVTINNVTIPIEFFNNFYFADCSGCGVELVAYDTNEMTDLINSHQC